MRYLAIATIALLTSLVSQAADDITATHDEAADTVSTALATVWSGHILPILEQNYGTDAKAKEDFIKGISEAFNVSPDQEPYYQGILQGFTVMQRLGQMRELGLPAERDAFLRALGVALNGGDTGFTPTSADAYLNSYMSRKYEAMAAADTLSMASQMDFLARERAREGVIETPSGLLFQVITEGEGMGPSLDDAVAVTYTGRLYNGEIFDEAETPVTFPVKGLVEGFSQGLLMMKPGGTYRIVIPPALGYGPSGTAGIIPGNAALDFTITLHGVIKQ